MASQPVARSTTTTWPGDCAVDVLRSVARDRAKRAAELLAIGSPTATGRRHHPDHLAHAGGHSRSDIAG